MRIFTTTSYSYWGNVAPNALHDPTSARQIGGGETSMISLSFQLARLGHEVFLFMDVDRPQQYLGVDFLPKSYARNLITSLKGDILISWEDTQHIAMNHTCDLVIYAMQTNNLMMGVLDYAVDYYQCVSNWHREILLASDPSLRPSAREKFFILPNGVDPKRYRDAPPRVPGRIVYSSSPDRGLHHLLRMWPEIKKAVPHASLRVFYDMSKWFSIIDQERTQHGRILNTTERADLVRKGLADTEGMGVEVMGGIGQWRLAQEQMQAELLVYPCDSVDRKTEGFGITVLEALAAGTPVITTDCDAFGEIWTGKVEMIPLPVEPKEERWVNTIHRLLMNKTKWQERSKAGRKYAEELSWERVGQEYNDFLEQAVLAG